MKNVLPAELLESPPDNGLINEAQKVEESLYRKFEKFMSRQRQQNLNERLRNFYGKNYPIKYKQEYNFSEQWEGKGQSERHSDRNLL